MSAPTAPEIPDPPPGKFEGAGVVSSWADVDKAIREGGPFEIAFSGAVAALDTLGFVANPLDSLLQAGVGWLLEQVPFLSEPLSFLAGRPAEVIELSKAWAAVATELLPIGEDLRAMAAPGAGAAPPVWDGMAGRAFQEAAEARALTIATVAMKAEELATTLVNAGAAIGLVRSLVRDLIAEWVSFALQMAFLGLLSAGVTGGAGLAATVGGAILDAIRLGYRIADEISALIARLIEAGGTAGRVASAMRSTGNAVGTFATYAPHAAGPWDEYLSSIGAGEVLEAGKQVSAAHQI